MGKAGYKDGVVYVLEANPRASRTIPFVSKTVGLPLAKIAASVMIGRTLREMGYTKEPVLPYVSVKDGFQIRRNAVDYHVPYITTVQAAKAAAQAVEMAKRGEITIKALGEYHQEVR